MTPGIWYAAVSDTFLAILTWYTMLVAVVLGMVLLYMAFGGRDD